MVCAKRAALTWAFGIGRLTATGDGKSCGPLSAGGEGEHGQAVRGLVPG